MKNSKRNLAIVIALLSISVIVYFLQILLFHDSHETYFLFFQDLAFLPVEVILISFILEKYLNNKEKQEKFMKMQIVVSAFYSNVGSSLIRNFSHFNMNFNIFKEEFDFEQQLLHNKKKKISNYVNGFDFIIDIREGDLLDLKIFLMTKKTYILRIFENSNILEHDQFTNMLWSVYHVLDELESRDAIDGLPENDMDHLSVDIKRSYQLLIIEWVEYMTFLKKKYPYLFSLAIRKNPFDENEIIFK